MIIYQEFIKAEIHQYGKIIISDFMLIGYDNGKIRLSDAHECRKFVYDMTADLKIDYGNPEINEICISLNRVRKHYDDFLLEKEMKIITNHCIRIYIYAVHYQLMILFYNSDDYNSFKTILDFSQNWVKDRVSYNEFVYLNKYYFSYLERELLLYVKNNDYQRYERIHYLHRFDKAEINEAYEYLQSINVLIRDGNDYKYNVNI